MASIERTAYPRLKQNFTKAELRDFYTPDLEEIFFVRETARCDEGEPAAQVSKQYHICRSDLFKLKRRALLALKAALADKPMYARRCPYTRAPRAGPCVLTQHAYLQREASSPVAAPRLTSAISNPSFPYGWCVNSLPSGLTTAEVGIDIDGAPLGSVVVQGVTQPFMFILSAQIESSDWENSKVKADIKSIYDGLPPEGRLRVEIRGANHYLFSDDSALLKSHVIMGMLRMFGVLGIDGSRQLAITAYCVRDFFDTYLKGEGVSPLKISSPLYPEIRVLE